MVMLNKKQEVEYPNTNTKNFSNLMWKMWKVRYRESHTHTHSEPIKKVRVR